MITNIWCSWNEFDEYELDKKYNLVDCGMSKKHVGYKWLYDAQNNVNVYVRQGDYYGVCSSYEK